MGERRYYSRGWPASCRECGALAYDRPHGLMTTLLALLNLIGLHLPPYRKFRTITPASSLLSRRLAYTACLVTIAALIVLATRLR